MTITALAGLTLLIIAAYLLGSLSGSLLLGRVYRLDIRQSGSGNAGGTNALRARGWRFALPVVMIDVGKGAVATGLMPLLWPLPLPPIDAVAAACGVAAILGHVFPVFFGFRGGKGAATFVGGLLGMLPLVALGLMVLWLLCLTLTGFVGLSTICASLGAVLLSLWLAPEPSMPWAFVFCVLAAMTVVLAHHSNVRRLFAGTEPRMPKAMVFRRWQ